MLSSAGISQRNSFARALSPLISATILFGPGERIKTKFNTVLSGVIFSLLLTTLAFVAVLGVFVRTTIDTWIQFSLYIVPLLSLICGWNVYRSEGFNTLLERKLGKWYGALAIAVKDDEIHESNRGPWLRRSAIKNCVYPLVMELYQWSGYAAFHVLIGGNKFAGAWKEHQLLIINDNTWTIIYAYFWTVGVYITGFVSYSFILVARLTIRDAISFMCRFGDSPFLPHKPTHRGIALALSDNTSSVKKFILLVVGFLSLDLLDTGKDIVLFYEHENEAVEDTSLQRNLPGSHVDLQQALQDSSFEESVDVRPRSSSLSVPKTPKINPNDACKCLTKFIGNLDALASTFQPFIILLAFFSVANFATHIVAIVIKIKDFQDTHWWTFARTLLWLLLAIRLLWSCATITRMLSRIPMHVDYLRCIGVLQGSDKEWEGFFRLMNTLQLRSKTYGFPLSLKQVAYCATFLNFAFLIVLSIMHPKTN